MVEKKAHSTLKPWLIALAFTAWATAVFMLVRGMIQELVPLLVRLGVDLESMNPAILQTVATAVMWVIAVSVVIGVPYLLFKDTVTRKDIGLHRLPTWSELGLAPAGYIASTIVAGLVVYMIARVVPGFDASEAQDTGFGMIGLQYEYIVAFITLVVIAPVAEEVFFRGYLYGKLKRYIPTWVAIIVVSALFGVAHGQWNVAIMTFIMGVFLCLLRDITGSLWPAITMHMIRNGIAYYFLFVNPTFINSLGV